MPVTLSSFIGFITLIIDNFLTVSLPAKNLPFQHILLTVDSFFLLGLTFRTHIVSYLAYRVLLFSSVFQSLKSELGL